MTLVELVVVIVIGGIVAMISSSFIVSAVTGYSDLARRAELVDAAEMSLRQLARDVRRALPNSVRVGDALANNESVTCDTAGTACAIEMLNTLDGARYREGPGINPGGHNHAHSQFRLNIGSADNDGFNVVGFFRQLAVPYSSATARLAIYNQGVEGANAYDDAQLAAGYSTVITNPAATTFHIENDIHGDEHRVILDTGNFYFKFASPTQRVFVVDGPVTYLCSPGPTGTVVRYWGYAIDASQPTSPTAPALAAASSQLLTTPVTSCRFSYQPGTGQRSGLITLDLTVGDTASGERVRLLYQAHVDNAP